MIKIKALNDDKTSEESNSSDNEDYQLTKEAEEEELNTMYLDSLKFAANGDNDRAIENLLKLKNELELPKIKDKFLLKRLKYLTYKNLGLFKNDLDFLFDALSIDNSDINLWIFIGKKSRAMKNYMQAKYCFEEAFNLNASNFAIIDNLIDCYFITNNLYQCVNVCLHCLNIFKDNNFDKDNQFYYKSLIVLNECIRSMPPILNDMNNEQKSFVTNVLGGHNDYDFNHNKVLIELVPKVLEPLELEQSNYYRLCCFNTGRNDSNEDDDRKCCKRRKLQLNLNQIDNSTFEKIGKQIESMYESIQKQNLNILASIHIQFEHDENDNGGGQQQENQTSNKDSNKSSENTDTKSTTDHQTQQPSKQMNEKQLLYEYVDKRRSSRVKTKLRSNASGSNNNNNQDYDEQNYYEILLSLIPESILKNDNSNPKSTTTTMTNVENENISSNSVSIQENINLDRLNELEAIDIFFDRLKSKFYRNGSAQYMNILDIIEFYLIEVTRLQKMIKITKIFSILYQLYREQNQLPFGLFCEIGKDISIDHIWLILLMNEIDYKKNEMFFLKEILCKLCFHLSRDELRAFLIRFFVLYGSIELDLDYLYYGLDLCENFDSKYFQFFSMLEDDKEEKMEQDGEINTKDENRADNNNDNSSKFEVIAVNKLRINVQYIQTLIDMQSVTKINENDDNNSGEQNYVDIIRICFTKNELDLNENEKHQLYQAIMKAKIWQKALDFFENWSHFNDECFECILNCITLNNNGDNNNNDQSNDNGRKGRLSGKLLKKIIKYAIDGHSILPWLIIHETLISGVKKSDDDDDHQSQDNNSDFEHQERLIKFFKLGHQILGRRNICTANDGKFLWLAQKHFINNDLEDDALHCFSCLFKFPPQKSLPSSLDHGNNAISSTNNNYHSSKDIELKWEHCYDIYQLFVPEVLPEFDSNYRQIAITLETKEFFLKILTLIPESEKPKHILDINNYIKRGTSIPSTLTNDENDNINHNRSITSTLYYLLADHHFKTKDFAKAKYFYIHDLAINANRFDSWAGLALSLNYQVDQLLIEGLNTNNEKFFQTSFSTIKCFEQALQLQPDNSKLWIEFGILCYNLASNISRLRKRKKFYELNQSQQQQPSINELIIENEKFYTYEQMIMKSKFCFEKILEPQINNDESWLSYYMLGKVNEKSSISNNNNNSKIIDSNQIMTILQYYEWAYLNLYLDGATYPKKINYYQPSLLSIESLEIYYRIHSCILKYLVNNRKFTLRILRELKYYLIKVNKSPFILRKSFSNSSQSSSQSQTNNQQQIIAIVNDMMDFLAERQQKIDPNQYRNDLIQMCLNGIKICLQRYNGHYKSYYRLANYYYQIRDYTTAKQIMFGMNSENRQNPLLYYNYNPLIDNQQDVINNIVNKCGNSTNNYITSLFLERKSTNLFNGIWCIPVDEIERAGNFNSHMFRCIDLMINICIKLMDYNQLCLIAMQLYKKPDNDKKYLNHNERIVLSYKAFNNCFEIFEKKIYEIHLNVSSTTNSSTTNIATLTNQVNDIIKEIRRIVQMMEKMNTFTVEIKQKSQQIYQYFSNLT